VPNEGIPSKGGVKKGPFFGGERKNQTGNDFAPICELGKGEKNIPRLPCGIGGGIAQGLGGQIPGKWVDQFYWFVRFLSLDMVAPKKRLGFFKFFF